MLIVISPAKNLDYKTEPQINDFTIPEFMEESVQLITKMKTLSRKKIKDLMSLSDNLASLNHERYDQWTPDCSAENAKQSILTFNGEVYWGIEAKTMNETELQFAQKHLRMLSTLSTLKLLKQ